MDCKLNKDKIGEIVEKLRPQLQMDGGDVELVDVTDDGIVKVRLMGHCRGCAFSQMTLKMGIERAIKQIVPEIKYVESVP